MSESGESIDAIAARRREAMNNPSSEATTKPEPVTSSPAARPTRVPRPSSAPLVIAGVWTGLALIFAVVLLSLAKDEAYGGDAYTGIQNAVMLAVRGIAFLLLGSAALGLLIALRRDRL